MAPRPVLVGQIGRHEFSIDQTNEIPYRILYYRDMSAGNEATPLSMAEFISKHSNVPFFDQVYCECGGDQPTARHNASLQRELVYLLASMSPPLKCIPQVNKGAGFTPYGREAPNLNGSLPSKVKTMKQQVGMIWRRYQACHYPLEKHRFLRNLQKGNQRLYHALLVEHLEECIPIVCNAPTIGDSCRQFSASTTLREVVVNFWSDGFSVDDGPLRSFDNPKDKSFLYDINQNRIPAELRQQLAAEMDPVLGEPRILIRLVDKVEPYAPPAKTFKAFAAQYDSPSSSSTAPGKTAPPVAMAAKPATRNFESPLHMAPRLVLVGRIGRHEFSIDQTNEIPNRILYYRDTQAAKEATPLSFDEFISKHADVGFFNEIIFECRGGKPVARHGGGLEKECEMTLKRDGIERLQTALTSAYSRPGELTTDSKTEIETAYEQRFQEMGNRRSRRSNPSTQVVEELSSSSPDVADLRHDAQVNQSICRLRKWGLKYLLLLDHFHNWYLFNAKKGRNDPTREYPISFEDALVLARKFGLSKDLLDRMKKIDVDAKQVQMPDLDRMPLQLDSFLPGHAPDANSDGATPKSSPESADTLKELFGEYGQYKPNTRYNVQNTMHEAQNSAMTPNYYKPVDFPRESVELPLAARRALLSLSILAEQHTNMAIGLIFLPNGFCQVVCSVKDITPLLKGFVLAAFEDPIAWEREEVRCLLDETN